jgi:nitroreductase
MNLIESLEWRYATKRMNGEQIPEEKMNNILDAVQLAPSSYGLTPYTVIVVQDPAVKEKLAPQCYNQPQIKESSALLIFAPWKKPQQGVFLLKHLQIYPIASKEK